jgi:hypothetical protein
MRLDSRIRAVLVMAVAAALVGLGAAAGWEAVRAQSQSHPHSHGRTEKGWLSRLGPDARVAAIERQFRGFETTMAEVAYRYTEMYFGALDGNWGYAEHMAHTMGDALTTGLERRPQLRKSADAHFLTRSACRRSGGTPSSTTDWGQVLHSYISTAAVSSAWKCRNQMGGR